MNKVLNLIGLCARARLCISGESMVLESVSRKKSFLVIISNDILENTKDKITRRCQTHNVELIQLDVDKYDLGNAIGKPFRVCISINDRGFAKSIKNKIQG